MKAMLLKAVHDLSTQTQPLELTELPIPVPGEHEILIKISCCGVCHTELDEIEGRTPPPIYPVVPGHQIVGHVESNGTQARRFRKGERVGVAWIFSACGQCEFCRAGLENLCARFIATGRDAHGGYAQFMKVSEEFAYAIPEFLSDAEAAPLLCAGAVGFRSLRLAGIADGQTLGLTGFGASGHLVLKMTHALYPHSRILVFARSDAEQTFARSLGAFWAGDTSATPPIKANAIIDTTPAWKPVLESLLHLHPGGRLVINAIRKESVDRHMLLEMRYSDHLWMEKEIKSVANITRADVKEFLGHAERMHLKPEVEIYPFQEANRAVLDLRRKQVRGAKVLTINPGEC